MNKREAVLFQNGAIGDFLMFLWLAQQLWVSGAFCKITIVVPRNSLFWRSFLEEYPYVQVLEVSRPNWLQGLQYFFALKDPITAVIHPTIGRIPLFVKLFSWVITRKSGGILIGFQDKGILCRTLYTHTLVYDTTKLYSDTVRDILRKCGVQPDMLPPHFVITEAQGTVESFGLQAKKYIVFHPCTSTLSRAVTVEAVLSWIAFVQKKYPDFLIVLSGGERDRGYIAEIISQQRMGVVAAIGLDAQKISTLLKGARLYIGVDTGISHLACFLGVPAIVVAHVGTATNWLPFYASHVTVLYRLRGDAEAHTGPTYLHEHAHGHLRPFEVVPAEAIEKATTHALNGCAGLRCDI